MSFGLTGGIRCNYRLLLQGIFCSGHFVLAEDIGSKTFTKLRAAIMVALPP
jgi:hypothetical protein